MRSLVVVARLGQSTSVILFGSLCFFENATSFLSFASHLALTQESQTRGQQRLEGESRFDGGGLSSWFQSSLFNRESIGRHRQPRRASIFEPQRLRDTEKTIHSHRHHFSLCLRVSVVRFFRSTENGCEYRSHSNWHRAEMPITGSSLGNPNAIVRQSDGKDQRGLDLRQDFWFPADRFCSRRVPSS